MSSQPLSECRALTIKSPSQEAGLFLAYLNAKCNQLAKIKATIDTTLEKLCSDSQVIEKIDTLKKVTHDLFLLESSRATKGIKIEVGGETTSIRELLDEKSNSLSLADKVTLKRYYRLLASKHHPRDRDTDKRFSSINAAYRAGSLELLYLFLATENWYSLEEEEVRKMVSMTLKKIDEIKLSNAFKVTAAAMAGSKEKSRLLLLAAIDEKINLVKRNYKIALYGNKE